MNWALKGIVPFGEIYKNEKKKEIIPSQMKKERNENLKNKLPKPEQHTLRMVAATSAPRHLYPCMSVTRFPSFL